MSCVQAAEERGITIGSHPAGVREVLGTNTNPTDAERKALMAALDEAEKETAADALESDWILAWEEEMAERRARKAAKRKKKKPQARDWG